MKASAHKIKTLLKTIFTVDHYRVRKEKDTGELLGEYDRVNIDRGDAVAVVLFNPAKQTVVLIHQFRLASYTRGGDGMLWEIPAGMIELQEQPETVAIRETLEETGFSIHSPQPILKTIIAPGIMNEYIHLYYAEYNDASRVADGGGLAHEGEHIEVHEFTLERALLMVDQGEIEDAKTILGLQWLQLNN
jgi:GDP-mannose pyrophosphatase NudK